MATRVRHWYGVPGPLQLVADYRGTLLIAVALIVSAAVVNSMSASTRASLVHDLGFDQNAFLSGRWWVVVVSPFVQPNPGLALRFWTMTLSAVLASSVIERMLGHWAPIAVFFGTHIASTFLTLAALKLFAVAGSAEAERLLTAKDTGVSAAVVGLIGFAFGIVRDRRVVWMWAGMGVWLIWGALFRFRMDTSLAHTFAVFVGFAAGIVTRTIREERQQ